jgi:hypothetical protein
MNNSNTELMGYESEETKAVRLIEKRKLEVIKAIASGTVSTVEEIADMFSLPITAAISLMDDPSIVNAIQQYTRVRSNLLFHAKGMSKLEEIVESEDDKTALAGLKLLAQLSNNLKPDKGVDVNINLSLESLVKETEKKVNPVIDIN